MPALAGLRDLDAGNEFPGLRVDRLAFLLHGLEEVLLPGRADLADVPGGVRGRVGRADPVEPRPLVRDPRFRVRVGQGDLGDDPAAGHHRAERGDPSLRLVVHRGLDTAPRGLVAGLGRSEVELHGRQLRLQRSLGQGEFCQRLAHAAVRRRLVAISWNRATLPSSTGML